jgi:hypothetical protein
MEENDKAEDKQKGSEIANNAPAECVQMRQKIGPHDPLPHP